MTISQSSPTFTNHVSSDFIERTHQAENLKGGEPSRPALDDTLTLNQADSQALFLSEATALGSIQNADCTDLIGEIKLEDSPEAPKANVKPKDGRVRCFAASSIMNIKTVLKPLAACVLGTAAVTSAVLIAPLFAFAGPIGVVLFAGLALLGVGLCMSSSYNLLCKGLDLAGRAIIGRIVSEKTAEIMAEMTEGNLLRNGGMFFVFI